MRVLIAGGGTGGHLMPALALARALAEARPDVQPVLVGAQRGIESQVLPRYPFRYHLLPLEPIHRRAWWRNVRWPLVAWRVWRAVSRVLDAERPVLVIGTGGYAAGPVLWLAQRRGLPIVLQESDAFPGITTRWLARRARQVHLGFPEARARLRLGPATEVLVHGNPIRPPEPGTGDRAAAVREFGLDPVRPCVLVFGGSQGARAINEALAGALARGLLDRVNVLWGTGTTHAERYTPFARSGQVAVRGFFDPMAPAYRAADLVVCRAGALTVAELCAWGKPSVLVPLPTAAADHQAHNARALAAAGAAIHLPEKELTPGALAELVNGLAADRTRLEALAAGARVRGHPESSKAIVSSILTLL
ncbi:MAG: undecaprenyldiphospho-muramoylpentapeptide beta-N-acetylglucosaminyltransferase [Gemmatimonadetes bacterium]|nr:undecaprenyldiphospho-muramoylpentapeptide beta-N-acetylglucosaminyltransferase [Gemmatimonadota bacterium]